MKIVKEYKEQLAILPNTYIPYLGTAMEHTISNWAFGKRGGDGHGVIEKFISVIDDYEFDPDYSEIIDEKSFKLKTTDGKIVTIEFTYGDGLEFFSSISVTEGNIERKFDVDTYNKNLYVDMQYHEEKDTGFVQFYYYQGDHFYKKDGDKRVSFYINNPNYSYQQRDEIMLIDEQIKEEFKKIEFPTILDAFHFITDRIPGLANFEIKFYKLDSWDTTDEVIVKDGYISSLKFYKKVNGSNLTIKENFPNPGEESLNVAAELDQFKNRHDEIQRKLTQTRKEKQE